MKKIIRRMGLEVFLMGVIILGGTVRVLFGDYGLLERLPMLACLAMFTCMTVVIYRLDNKKGA